MDAVDFEKLKLELADNTCQVRDIFNENLHNTYSSALIRKLSIVAQMSKKVFVPVVMQIPFNPFTGKADTEFNSTRKWVTAKSPVEIMKFIKQLCHEDPELKEKYQKNSGFKGVWDTSNLDICDTFADKAVMWVYRRGMSYSTVVTSINSPQITGSDWGQAYALGTAQDPDTGAFTGDISFLHTMCSMVGSLSSAEVKSYGDALTKNDPNNLCKLMGRPFTINNEYLQKSPTSVEAKNQKSDIRKLYPMSSPYSAVAVPVLAFDLAPRSGLMMEMKDNSEEYTLLEHFGHPEDLDIKTFLHYNSSMGIRTEIDNIMGNYFPSDPKDYKTRNVDKDVYPNWVVMDYILNDERTELTKEERFECSQRLKFTQEGTSMYDITTKTWKDPKLEFFVKSLDEFFKLAEDEEYIKTIQGFIASEYKQPSKSLEEAATIYLRNNLPITSAVYSQNIRVKYCDLLQEIFPEDQGIFVAGNIEVIAEKSESLMEEILNEGVTNVGTPTPEDEDSDSDEVFQVID